MEDFATQEWREILAHNGLDGFEDLWNLAHRWVERPNTRHGGFGGVARHELATREGGRRAFYVKIHRNRLRRTATRPWKSTPALWREFENHRRCAEAGVLSPPPLYCASRRQRGEQRGVLVTEELTGFRPLRELLARWGEPGGPPRRERSRVIEAVAQQLRSLHAAGLVARSYTPEHVYVRSRADSAEVRLVDLERVKWAPLRRRARVRDLVTLHLAAPSVGRSDRLRFLRAYHGAERLTPGAKRLWRRVAAGARAKSRRRREARRRRRQPSPSKAR